MKRLIASALCCGLVLGVPAHADIQKCKKADGSFYFTDKLCPTDAKLEESIAQKAPAPPKERKKIVFDGDLYQQFSKAKSILVNTEVQGSECEWAIKVDKRMSQCIEFLALVLPGGDFEQAIDKLNELPKVDSKNEIPKNEYTEILRVARKVIDHKNLMTTHLGMDSF